MKKLTPLQHERLNVYLIVSEFLTFCSKDQDCVLAVNPAYEDVKKFKKLQKTMKSFAKHYCQDMAW